MISLLLILAGLAIVALLNLVNPGSARDNDRNDDYNCPDYNRVHEIIKAAFLDLKKQRATGFGPWLSALLDGGPGFYFTGSVNENGRCLAEREWRRVGPDVALTAVRFTLQELAGGRFNLDGLRRAEAELEKMTGAGE